MATTSPNNLRTPNPTDNFNLVADLATLASDVQNALVKRANLYIGTSAQRTAFTTAPEGTHWQDTNGSKSEWVRQGGNWVSTVTPDTGWTTLPNSSGITGSLRWRCVGKLVEVRWNGSGSFPVGATTLTGSTIPEVYRPDQNMRGSGALNANAAVGLYVSNGGVVGLINSSGATRTAGEGHCLYFI